MPAHLLTALIGLWLMVAPAVLGYGSPAAQVDRIIGPLVLTFGVTAAWAVTRGLRWVNTALALLLLIAPWLVGYERAAAINSVVAGGVVAGLSLVRGRIRHSMGGGWAALRRR